MNRSRERFIQAIKTAVFDPSITLYPHQRHAVDRFLENDGQLLFAHGTGTGKTLGSIAALESGRDAGIVNRTLVITPTGLRRNYASRLERHTDQSVQILGNLQEAKNGEAEPFNTTTQSPYTVVGIELFRSDPVGLIQRLGIDTIVFDEVHKAKDPYGSTYKALMAARSHVRNAIGLTASESSNSPVDLIPLLDFTTNKDHDLGSQKDFQNRFFAVTGYEEGLKGGKKPVYSIINTDELQDKLGKYLDFVDVTAMDPDRFPSTDIKTVEVEMSDHQRRLYDYAMNQAPALAQEIIRSGAPPNAKDISHVFKSIMLARQAANSTHTLDTSISLKRSAQDTPKIKQILDDVEEHLETTPDAQIFIYSNLIKGGVDVITAGLEARGVPYGLFIGKSHPGSSEEERQRAVSQFRKGELQVIVASGAGAEGIDLPNTTLELIADGHYNPARIEQAEARGVRSNGLAHRPPDRRNVEIRRYVSTVPGERSVDQWIYGVASRKNKPIGQFREVLRETNPEIYEQRERIEAGKPERIPTIDLSKSEEKLLKKSPITTVTKLPRAQEVGKTEKPVKYISRWKDPNTGEWRYKYPKKGQSGLSGVKLSFLHHLVKVARQAVFISSYNRKDGTRVRGHVRYIETDPESHEGVTSAEFLEKYRDLYKGFDRGHGPEHMKQVQEAARTLAKKYLPNQVELAEVAAVLHDVGLLAGRETHELEGPKTLKKDPAFKAALNTLDRSRVLHAIRQHRASTGKPRTTLAKIVSDADRTPSSDDMPPMQRAYNYGLKNFPDMTEEEQLLRAGKHLKKKFGPGGTGRRTYFKETEEAITEAYRPIIEAYDKRDMAKLRELAGLKKTVKSAVEVRKLTSEEDVKRASDLETSEWGGQDFLRRNDEYYGAFVDGKLVGAMRVNTHPNAILTRYAVSTGMPGPRPQAWISSIVVSKNARGKGVGTLLHKHLQEKYDRIALGTGHRSHESVMKINNKLGYRVVVSRRSRGSSPTSVWLWERGEEKTASLEGREITASRRAGSPRQSFLSHFASVG